MAARRGVISLFHDTHHRSLTEPWRVAQMGLDSYSAVLAYGPSIAEIYRSHDPRARGWWCFTRAPTPTSSGLSSGSRAATSSSSATGATTIGTRLPGATSSSPAGALPDLGFALFGVRYPREVLAALRQGGIAWGGWLPNYLVPEAYAVSKVTVHIPRKEYVEELHGTPTIRVFEALACGVPLVSAGWRDDSGLFEEGADYLAVDTPAQMAETLRWLATDADARDCHWVPRTADRS